MSELPSLSVRIATTAPAADKAGSTQVRSTKMNLNSTTMALCVLRSSPVSASGKVAAIMSVSSRTEIKSLVQSTAPNMRRKMCDHLTPSREFTRKSQRLRQNSFDSCEFSQ